jgi:hypothetical protein
MYFTFFFGTRTFQKVMYLFLILLQFMERRCLTAQQCNSLTNMTASKAGENGMDNSMKPWLTYKPDDHGKSMCVTICPAGYMPENDTQCVKCSNSCPKGQYAHCIFYFSIIGDFRIEKSAADLCSIMLTDILNCVCVCMVYDNSGSEGAF